MLIPYNTDAPIYYYPYATIGLIATNVLVFFLTAGIAANDRQWMEEGLAEFAIQVDEEGTPVFTDEEMEDILAIAEEQPRGSLFVLGNSPKVLWLTLEFGKLNPVQWFTHNFMHADILHLLGNMIFLWGFGLVVEGKLGWQKYLAVYAVICLMQGAFIQIIMFLLSDGLGVALGASGVIYGIMAIAVLWAPQNEMSCFLLIFLRPKLIELSIMAFGSFYLALQVLFFVLYGFQMSSEALHLSGILMGLPIGILFLKRSWVDCEGWDFFTVYFAKKEQQDKVRSAFRDQNQLAAVKEAKEERDQARATMLTSLRAALEAKQHAAAVGIYKKTSGDLQQGKKVPTQMLPLLINAVHKQQEWELSIPLLVELLQRPGGDNARVRLKLAQILIQATDQPKQGIAVLKKLPVEALDDKQRLLRNKLAKAAKAALAEGSFEVEVKDW